MSPADLIQLLRDGLEIATKGPWALAVGRAGELFIIQRGVTELDDVPISGCFERDEDAAYLSSCSPDNIRTLLDSLASKDTALAEIRAENERLRKTVRATLTWAEQRCPCRNEEPNPCPLCGASVENLEGCKSAENTLPRHILESLRAASRAISQDGEERP